MEKWIRISKSKEFVSHIYVIGYTVDGKKAMFVSSKTKSANPDNNLICLMDVSVMERFYYKDNLPVF